MYNLPSESAANIWTEQKKRNRSSSINHPRKIVQSERENRDRSRNVSGEETTINSYLNWNTLCDIYKAISGSALKHKQTQADEQKNNQLNKE